MRLLLRFAALSAAERTLRGQAVAALWFFRLALWMIPLPRIKKFLDKISPCAHTLKPPVSPQQIGGAIASSSRFVPHATCLVQALAAQWILRRQNLVSHLHVGIIKQEDGQLAAHAWVECDGIIVVGGGGLERYTPILRWKNG